MRKAYFKLNVITPDGVVFSENVVQVRAPGKNGKLGVLVGHIPFCVLLKPGLMEVEAVGPNTVFSVSDGVASLDAEGAMNVLADTAEDARKIDIERARRAKERAENRLRQQNETVNIKRAKAALHRSLNRLHAANQI